MFPDNTLLAVLSDLAINFSAAYFATVLLAISWEPNAILILTSLAYAFAFLILAYAMRKQLETK